MIKSYFLRAILTDVRKPRKKIDVSRANLTAVRRPAAELRGCQSGQIKTAVFKVLKLQF